MLPHNTDAQTLSQSNRAQVIHLGRCLTGPIVGQLLRHPVIWRPWVVTVKDNRQKNTVVFKNKSATKGGQGFQHPTRLFVPKSRTEEYMSHMGEKVLASFPVQATLHFYNDDSSSDEDGEEAEEQQGTERVQSHPC